MALRRRRAAANGTLVNTRLILPMLALLALLFAPFGRVAAAQAVATPNQGAAVMAGHCNEIPVAPEPKSDEMAVDCMIACAVVAAPAAPSLASPPAAQTIHAAGVPGRFIGLHPESDPPPPRLS